MRKIRYTYLLLVLMMLAAVSNAQQNLTLFLMHDVPQANIVNPAVQSRFRLIAGVPGLASVHVGYNNTAFSLNEALRYDAAVDSSYFDFDKVVDGLNKRELIETSIHYTPLYAGFWIKKNYFTFAVTEEVTSYNTLSKEAAQLAWYGNTPFVGQEVSFKNLRANAQHLRHYSFGIARSVSDRLTVGMHAKLMFGKGSVYMPKTNGGLTSNERNFDTVLSADVEINSSFPIAVEVDEEGYVSGVALQDDVDWTAYMMNRQNLGTGFDFGLIYEYDKRTVFSASLLNVGFVGWKSNVNTFVSNGVFEYTGTDSSTDFYRNDYVKELHDSLRHQFIPMPDNKAYTSRLVPEIYLGASRTFTEHLNGGAVVYSRILRNKIQPALTLSANTRNYKMLNASVSYTAINGDYFNIGAGMGLKLGVVHLHAAADNLFGFFKLADQRYLNLRFGLSIVPAGKETKEKTAKSKNGISALPCYVSPYKETRKRRKRK